MNTDNNPFKAPEARVADAGVGSGEFIADGQRVPAGNGVAWLSRGWEIFKQAPGVWIGIAVIFMVMMIVLSVIPLINLVVDLLDPGLHRRPHAGLQGAGRRRGFAGRPPVRRFLGTRRQPDPGRPDLPGRRRSPSSSSSALMGGTLVSAQR